MEAHRVSPVFPAPIIVNDRHRIVATDYFDAGNLMRLAGHSWLDCHLGYLRLLYTGHPIPQHRWSFCEVAIITRGLGPERVEMLELFFPSDQEERAPLPVYLFRWQCNRFPSWQPGKRCWELEVYGPPPYGSSSPYVFFRRRVFYREDTIPCRKWWDGPKQDGSPGELPRRSTEAEIEEKLRLVRQSTVGPISSKEKPAGRYLSDKDIRQRINKAKQNRGEL